MNKDQEEEILWIDFFGELLLVEAFYWNKKFPRELLHFFSFSFPLKCAYTHHVNLTFGWISNKRASSCCWQPFSLSLSCIFLASIIIIIYLNSSDDCLCVSEIMRDWNQFYHAIPPPGESRIDFSRFVVHSFNRDKTIGTRYILNRCICVKIEKQWQ